MGFIQSLSMSFANWFIKKYPYTKYDTIEDQISVYDYVAQWVIGGLIKVVSLIGLSLLFGVLKEAILISLTFGFFRALAGGFHSNTFFKCVMESLILFIGGSLVAKYTLPYWTSMSIFILFIITILYTLYVIIKYIPRDSPHKRIDKPEDIQRFKRWSSYYLVGWTVLMSICLLFGTNIIIIASSFGLLLELFSISKVGYRTFEIIDGMKEV